jgi:hypothetical protein
VVAAWCAAGLVLYAFFLQISYGGRIAADGAGSALQGWDLIHGHLLLHGWLLSDVSFYTFELPLNGITEVMLGLGPRAAHVASALVYFIVAVLTVAVAVKGSRGAARVARAAVVVTILAVPLLAIMTVWLLVEEPDHVGTVVFMLVPALLIDRLPGKPADLRWVAPLVCVILAAGQMSDATVLYVGVPAIVVACGYRVLAARSLRSADAAIVVAAVASVPLELLVRAVMTRAGGYEVAPPNTARAAAGQWPGHAVVVWRLVRTLYGAVATPQARLGTAATILGIAGLAAAVAGIVRVALTWRRASRAEHILVLVIAFNLAVYTVSEKVNPYGFREIAAVLPCGAALAARAVVPATIRQARSALTAAAAAVLVGLVALAAAAARPHAGVALGPEPPQWASSPTWPVTAWLEEHRVTGALADYWSASTVTLESGGRLQVRAITLVPRTDGSGYDIHAPYWESNSLWFNPSLHDARYVVARQTGKYSPATYERFLGKPSAAWQVPGFVVLEYPENLLTRIEPMLGVGVGPRS